MSLAPLPKEPVSLLAHAASLAAKEGRHIVRNPRELALILMLPGVLTFLFGYAFEVGEVRNIRTAVVDEDGSPLAARLVAAMEASPTFRVMRVDLSREATEGGMDRDRYHVVVRIPKGLERVARATGRATLTVDLSGIDTVSAPTAMRALSRIVMEENLRLVALRLSRLGLGSDELAATLEPVHPDFRIRYNPTLRFVNYVMPGIIGLILQLLTVGLMAGAITREKELGTFEALLASPVKPLAVLLGKTVPYLAVSLLEVATILGIARFGFGVSLGRGAVPALAVTVLFVGAALATGLLISAITDTQAQSLQVTVFYSLPVFMLSGAYAPLNVVPEDVRLVSWLFPLTYFCRAFRDVSLKGMGLVDVGRDVALLAGYAVLALALASLFLRKRLP